MHNIAKIAASNPKIIDGISKAAVTGFKNITITPIIPSKIQIIVNNFKKLSV